MKSKIREVERIEIWIDEGDFFSWLLSAAFAILQLGVFFVYYLSIKVAGLLTGHHFYLRKTIEEYGDYTE